MQKRNYQKELDKLTADFSATGAVPKLLIHSCCAPCSSYVLEYLSNYFEITVLYYNPNIYPEDEYFKRETEQEQFINRLPTKNKVTFRGAEFEPKQFYDAVKGLEQCAEGGERCRVCFRLRLERAARVAKEGGFDFFTTTLSISPLKKSDVLNEIGEQLADEYGVRHLPSDFKKKEGYKRSVELSKEYGIYRQDYCGCVFSKREREKQK